MSGLRHLRRSIADAQYLQRVALAGDEYAAVRLRTRHPGMALRLPTPATTFSLASRSAKPSSTRPVHRFAPDASPYATPWSHTASLAVTLGLGLLTGLQAAAAPGGPTRDHHLRAATTEDYFGYLLFSATIIYGGPLLIHTIMECEHLFRATFGSASRADRQSRIVFRNWGRAFTWPVDLLGWGLGAACDRLGRAATLRDSQRMTDGPASTLACLAHSTALCLRPSGPIASEGNAMDRDRPERARPIEPLPPAIERHAEYTYGHAQRTIGSGLSAAATALQIERPNLAHALLRFTQWRVAGTADPDSQQQLAVLTALIGSQRDPVAASTPDSGSNPGAAPSTSTSPIPAALRPTRQWLADRLPRDLAASTDPRVRTPIRAHASYLRTFDDLLRFHATS